jgi:Ulp1 family protease
MNSIFLFQGATIVDRVVNITSAEDYIYIPVNEQVHYLTNLCYINGSTLLILLFHRFFFFLIMQQLVVNEVTSTAPTADLEQPTEVPLNSSTFMFVSPLCYIMNFPSIRGQHTKKLL